MWAFCGRLFFCAIDIKRAESFGELSALFAFGADTPFLLESSCYGEFLLISSKFLLRDVTIPGLDLTVACVATTGVSGGMVMSIAILMDLSELC